jgi:hypothetical protein
MTNGVLASGAIRNGRGIRVSTELSIEQVVVEVTPGFIRLLAAHGSSSRASVGIWISESMAKRLGSGTSAVTIPLAVGGKVGLAGVFRWPDDGRDAALGFSVVSPVAPLGRFDACWIETWPQGDLSKLAWLSVVDSASVDPGSVVGTRRLNSSLGSDFDGVAEYQEIPFLPVTVAALVASFVAAFGLVRLRRLSIASALHAGVAKATMCVQLMLETCWWLIPGLALSGALVWIAADFQNPDSAWASVFPAARCLIWATVSALMGTLAGALITRERYLFRYFRAR